MKYFLNLLIIISQFINTVFLAGHPDQTISARAFENRKKKAWGVVYVVINKIFYWQSNHCLTSYLEDITRAKQLVKKAEGEVSE